MGTAEKLDRKMSKIGRTPNVMPSLNEANVEDLLKLKTMLEQSIDQGKPQSDSGSFTFPAPPTTVSEVSNPMMVSQSVKVQPQPIQLNEKDAKLSVLEEMKQTHYAPSKNQSSSRKPPYVRKIRTALDNMN